MRHDSLFYKLFPPPKFLTMPHSGLEISDDALRCVEYHSGPHGLTISKFARTEIPEGLVSGGDTASETKFLEILKSFVRENKLHYVKVSLPEEKVYLFQLDIPSTDVKAITQHVEFKLEENVPISAADAVFYFDILPHSVTGNSLRASVSVAQKKYVEKIMHTLHNMSLVPIAFEVAPKSIAKAVISNGDDDTHLIVHLMNRKSGIYIVSGGVVCFSSTISWGTRMQDPGTVPQELSTTSIAEEIHRVYAYWVTRLDMHSTIKDIVIVGRDASIVERNLHMSSAPDMPAIVVAKMWQNAFDVNRYIPPITKNESLEYAVAAGLALPN